MSNGADSRELTGRGRSDVENEMRERVDQILKGRNWLPMTVMGIMLGVDLVRVGIEDTFWTYPHKDEFIKKPSESVIKTVQIARELGREIATPEEARKILGIRVT